MLSAEGASEELYPLITIVTVNLNNRMGLIRTRRSIQAQDWKRRQWLVVDGGSHDGSVEELQAPGYLQPDTVLSEPDKGIYDAMNKGIALASGALLVFMNSGDCFSGPQVLSTVANSFMVENWKWGYGLSRVIDDNGVAESIASLCPYSSLRLALGLAVVPHQAAFYSREIVSTIGGFSEAAGLAADQDFSYRCGRLHPPRLWAEFFCDFEGGGVGDSALGYLLPRDMRRGRRARGEALFDSPTLDAAATGAATSVIRLSRMQQRIK